MWRLRGGAGGEIAQHINPCHVYTDIMCDISELWRRRVQIIIVSVPRLAKTQSTQMLRECPHTLKRARTIIER